MNSLAIINTLFFLIGTADAAISNMNYKPKVIPVIKIH